LYGEGVDQIQGRIVEAGPNAGTQGFYATDNLGSVRDIVDAATGEILFHAEYDAFGGATEYGAGYGDTLKYTAREYDADTGLQYNRARWYDNSVGRWMSEDPIGFAAGDHNLYRYVSNASTNATDPSGLFGDPFDPALIRPPIGDIVPDAVKQLIGDPTKKLGTDGLKWKTTGGSVQLGFVPPFTRPSPAWLIGTYLQAQHLENMQQISGLLSGSSIRINTTNFGGGNIPLSSISASYSFVDRDATRFAFTTYAPLLPYQAEPEWYISTTSGIDFGGIFTTSTVFNSKSGVGAFSGGRLNWDLSAATYQGIVAPIPNSSSKFIFTATQQSGKHNFGVGLALPVGTGSSMFIGAGSVYGSPGIRSGIDLAGSGDPMFTGIMQSVGAPSGSYGIQFGGVISTDDFFDLVRDRLRR
jgi:RHS repeat-associated protein